MIAPPRPFRSSLASVTLVGPGKRIRPGLRGHNAGDQPGRAGSGTKRDTPMQANDRRMPSLGLMTLIAGMLLGIISPALAQLPPAEEERLQILNDPEAIKKKAEKDKNRPPFEFFRSRVAPFDVIPYVKANHWVTLIFELRANDDDYDGFLQTDPVRMLVGSQQVSYRREARLLKEKRANLGLQIMVPSAQCPGSQGAGGGDGSTGCVCGPTRTGKRR